MALILTKHWRPRIDGRQQNYAPGDSLPTDHPKAGWLLTHGIAVDEDATDHPAPAETPAPEPATGPEQDTGDATPAPTSTSKRPPKVAKLEAWQDYARSQGIDPKGMKKEDIIARFI